MSLPRQPYPSRPPHSLTIFIFGVALLAFTGMLMLTGCDSDDGDSSDQIAEISIQPDDAELEVGEQIDFSVVARNAAGEQIPSAELDLEWESTDPDVFTVEDDGVATGQSPGSAFCTVAVTNRRFVGRDSAFVSIF